MVKDSSPPSKRQIIFNEKRNIDNVSSCSFHQIKRKWKKSPRKRNLNKFPSIILSNLFAYNSYVMEHVNIVESHPTQDHCSVAWLQAKGLDTNQKYCDPATFLWQKMCKPWSVQATSATTRDLVVWEIVESLNICEGVQDPWWVWSAVFTNKELKSKWEQFESFICLSILCGLTK